MNLLKKSLPFIIVICCCFLCSYLFFGSDSTFLYKYESNGITIFRINIYSYLNNINSSFGMFSNSINKYSSLQIRFDSVLNGMISILNCLIAVLNTLLIPFSLFSCISNVIFSFIGFPSNDSNFLYSMFNTISTLQVPYINYLS